MEWILHLATHQDIPALHELIPHSVHQLQKDYYSLELREGALGSVFGVDSQLIKDGTYFVVENNTGIIGCGGWSYRKLLYGSDQLHTIDESSLLDPKSIYSEESAQKNLCKIASCQIASCQIASCGMGILARPSKTYGCW
ncbi:hypothetical protein CAL7716_007770 [Calothrix sp. PCC 7716]|nr:hypothetical protein CAL7716_007770 [Calothrix sp. PCC 7716]